MSGRSRGGFHSQHGAPRPSRSLARGPALDPRMSDEEAIFRKVRGILNKLTIEKFEPLVQQLLCVGIGTENVLKGIIILLFEKALDEPKFSAMYAKVCERLAAEGPDFEPPNEDGSKTKTPTFLKLLLRKCQDEFENRSRAEELAKNAGSFKDLEPGSEAFRQAMAAHAELGAVRTKMLGNIRFIGELGKLDLLSERVLHSCIVQLLADVETPPEEDVECLCQLLKTVGERLDHDKARARIDTYFSRMQTMKATASLPPRIRFMIDDVVELRENRWVRRTLQKEAGPKSIMEIRLEAHEDQVKAIGNRRERAIGMQRIQRMREQMRLGNMGGMGHDGRELGFGGQYSDGPQPDMMHGGDHGMYPGMQGQDPYGGPPPQGFNGHGHHGGGSQEYNGHQDQFHQQQRRGPQPQENFRRLQQMGQFPQGGKVSLRPSTSLVPGRRGSGQHQCPQRPGEAMAPMGRGAAPNVPLGMQGRAPIDRVAAQKPKEKIKLSKAELETRSTSILEEFFGIADVAEAATCFTELGAPKHLSQFVVQAISMALDRKEADRESVVKLVSHFHETGLLSTPKLLIALEAILPEVEDLAIDVPLVKKYLGKIMAALISLNILSLADFVSTLQKGDNQGDDDRQDHHLLGFTLQNLAESEGAKKVAEMYAAAELNLMEYLPAKQQSEAVLLGCAETYGILFLFALQSMRRELATVLAEHLSITAIQEGNGTAGVKAVRAWLQSQPVETSKTDRFVFHVAVAVIGHIASSTTATAEATALKVDSSRWKELKVSEKKAFEVLATLLRGLAMEDTEKQKLIVYGAQAWCHDHGNPKGLMLRVSGHLYDMDVVEEPAFRAWREEVTDEFPGKATALIAINEYLNWMRTVEEEESEDEDSDDD